MAESFQSCRLNTTEQMKEFITFFSDILGELTDLREYQHLPADTIQHIAKFFEYTVPKVENFRGLITIIVYKMLEKSELQIPENIRLSYILGWCVEFLQVSVQNVNQIVDGSEICKGSPCWYRLPGIGFSAINDLAVMHYDIFFLLKKHFSQHPSYVALMEIFHDSILKVYTGNVIDCSTRNEYGELKLDLFTMERYISLCTHKSHYSFYLPVALAMYLANINDEEQHQQAKTILLEIGQLYQVQHDFLNSFGDTSKTGKVGSDIEEGKFTWLALIALQRASPAQRQIIKENYGKTAPNSLAIILQLYEDLDLPEAYAAYENESYTKITLHIHQKSKGLLHNVYFEILNKICKRIC